MKQFEKWLDKKSYSQAEERVAETTWREVLEWVLSLKEPDHTDIFYVINPTLIEKELQNE